MPELPEIETITQSIMSLTGLTIYGVVVRNKNLRYTLDDNNAHLMQHKTIVNIMRKAKYIVITLNVGYILIHLGMTGRLSITTNQDIQKHDHVDIMCGKYVLRYNDPRRFGFVRYYDTLKPNKLLDALGVEPLDDAFDAHYLLSKLHNKQISIKQAIMDNHIVVGVGNIYATEALFASHIRPTKIAKTLTNAECTLLVACIKSVLKHAIALGGSTIKDYKHTDGSLGGFQNQHKVYNKEGTPCMVCGCKILAIRLGQRNSFYCPNCQL